VTATPEAEANLERFRELNSRRMREMLDRIDAADLETVERALRILEAAVGPETESALFHPTTRPTSHHEGTRS